MPWSGDRRYTLPEVESGDRRYTLPESGEWRPSYRRYTPEVEVEPPCEAEAVHETGSFQDQIKG
jgi:hypothetical protein